jgi:hypothetical protein
VLVNIEYGEPNHLVNVIVLVNHDKIGGSLMVNGSDRQRDKGDSDDICVSNSYNYARIFSRILIYV